MTNDKDAKCPRCQGPCTSNFNTTAGRRHFRSTHDELMAAARKEWLKVYERQNIERVNKLHDRDKRIAKLEDKLEKARESIRAWIQRYSEDPTDDQ